jgi:hypothetical protein
MATLHNQWQLYPIQQGGLTFSLLASGDVFKIMDQEHQVNLLHGNLLDGMIANIYLREKLASDIKMTASSVIVTIR